VSNKGSLQTPTRTFPLKNLTAFDAHKKNQRQFFTVDELSSEYSALDYSTGRMGKLSCQLRDGNVQLRMLQLLLTNEPNEKRYFRQAFKDYK